MRRRTGTRLSLQSAGLLCAVLSVLTPAHTARQASAQPVPTFVRIDDTRGLASNEVWSAYRDATGILWIGTATGLQRWGGEGLIGPGFRADSSPIPAGEISGILPFAGGLMVGSNGGGIARLHATDMTERPVSACESDTEPPPLYIRHLTPLADQRVFVGAGRTGPWVLTPDSYCPFRFASPADSARGIGVEALAQTPDGRTFFGTWDRGLFSTTMDGIRIGVLDSIPHPSGQIRDLAYDPRGYLWSASSGAGVIRHDLDSGEMVRLAFLTRDGARPDNRNTSLHLEGDRLWIGSQGGLSFFNTRTRTLQNFLPELGDPNSLCHEFVADIYDDKQGMLWVLTDGGVCGVVLNHLDHRFVTVRGEARLIAAAADPESFFLGTEFAIERRATDGLEVLEELPLPARGIGGRPAVPVGIVERGPAILTATSQHGLFRRNRGDWTRIGIGPLAETTSLTGLIPTRGGALVQTFGRGVIGVSLPEGTPHYQILDEGSSTTLTGLSDGEGTVWMDGRAGGLVRIAPGDSVTTPVDSWPRDSTSTAFSRVEDLTISPDGVLWAATRGGVVKYDPKKETHRVYVPGSGLPAGRTVAAAWHGDNLWVATDHSLSRLDTLNHTWDTFFAPPGSDEGPFLAKGLLSHGGRLVAARESGLWLVDTESEPPTAPPPVVEFVSASLEGGRLSLPRGEDGFDLALRLADLAHPGDVLLSAHLIGHESAPTQASGTELRRRYTGVQPRKEPYHLRLTALSSSGDYHTMDYSVRVRRFVWQTLWFRSLLAILLVGTVGGTALTRTRRRQREAVEIQTALAESREDERQLLSRHIHDGPLQTLYSIGHRIELLEEEPEPEGFQALLKRNDDAIDALRRICANLRPSGMGQLALDRTVGSYCSSFQQDHPAIRVDRDLHEVGTLTEPIVVCVYRVLQSALANVSRHAQATTVKVGLQKQGQALILSVADDGVGFKRDTSMLALARGRHFGLLGMREWAERAGGHLGIDSEPGKGTTLTLTVPLSD